ncbi:hypothetical protein LPB137_01515 [Poseidonibacter parvus]|uniref:histidine kinase n=1 Tax=Poseidonibacter parvus TaxID=1850254 RepID=A0A1P8KJ72_9BACT|nr:HAMP domain-containing sensor histidine kinase [Poseidonibacter parvus]APW64608.1 hypothetical protein LPB137_01515 [Poseidonibacter parvus]
MKSLRQRALDVLENKEEINIDSIDIKEVIEELHVNQIELELQNQELRDQETVLLQAEEEELMLLFMNAPIGYLVLDNEYYIHRYNKHAFEIFNFLESRRNIYFFSFFKNMNQMNSFISWVKSNNSTFFDISIKSIKGEIKWIRVTHEITKLNNKSMYLLSVVDITKEKEKKEKLHLYDTALDKLPVSIIITDKDGHITYVNKELISSSGYSKEELIGERPSVFKSGFTSPKEYSEIWNSISNGDTWTGILKNLSKSKKISWMAVAISPIFDEKKNIINYIAVETNIDEKIKMEEKLKKQEDIMLVQARHAAMGEMISIIAHQWRQPLSVISTAATGIKMQKEFYAISEEDEIKSLDMINESAQYLSETIEDFKNFFKNNKILAQTNGNKIIEKIKKLNSETLRSNNINFNISTSDTSDILTYENELLQVLINIINNAKDALLAATELIANPFITIKIYNQDTSLVLEIEDNAGGIAEEIMDRIFEPYFTTKGPASGTGLGLYITKTIIDKHLKGLIEVKNTDLGALFIVTIPNLEN